MTAPVLIRLRPADFDKCAALWDLRADPAETRRLYDELRDGRRLTYAAVLPDGSFAGEATLIRHTREPHYTIPGRRLCLTRLMVRPDCRRQGIGGRLIDRLVGAARSLGGRELSLSVDDANTAARRLYAAKGFDTTLFEGADGRGAYRILLKLL